MQCYCDVFSIFFRYVSAHTFVNFVNLINLNFFVFRALYPESDINCTNFWAARMGSVPQVTFLLEVGADVTIANGRGLTPLQVS
jgi:hypothetical protein